jgi:hypothetical protein
VKTVVSAIGTVVVGVVVVGGSAFVLHAAPKPPPTVTATVTNESSTVPGVTKTASLELSAYPDSEAITWRRSNGGVGPHPDWVSYGPSTVLQVPAHALITVTIKQYDSGEPIPNAWLAQVHGTVGGTATIDGKVVTGIDPNKVGHTFTIHNFPSSKQPTLFVSVPLPATPDDAKNVPGTNYAKPRVVTFQFVTGDAGTYAWNCEFPCGENYASFGGPMSTFGYMAGTLKVV